MLHLLWSSALIAYLCSIVTSHKPFEIVVARDDLPRLPVVAERGIFSTIGVCSESGCSTPSSSVESDAVPSPSQLSTSSSTSRSSTPTLESSALKPTSNSGISTSAAISETSSSPSQEGLVLALTTTFTPPAACTTDGIRITEIATLGPQLGQDLIDPEVSSAYTSCLPSQFYSSILATATLPPFEGLICPYNWESYNLTSTYVICCPNGFQLLAPQALNNTQRPGLDSVCYSQLGPNELMDITSYDSTGASTVIPTSAGSDGTLVFAYAFDGFIGAGITVPPASIPGVPTSASTTPGFAAPSTTSGSRSGPTSSSKSSASSLVGSTVQAIFFMDVRTSNLRIVLVLVLSFLFAY